MSGIEETHRRYYDREMAARAQRPLGADREERVRAFTELCRQRGLSTVLEVGCGAGRDGALIRGAGLAYTGLDASASAVGICRGLGLEAVQGSALELPFGDDSFDAGWSMSTLMHLPGDGLGTALAELRRVVRPGGVVEVGVWGGDRTREWTDEHGRYFSSRTDAGLRAALGALGEVVGFATWSHFDDGGHYQWARVLVSGERIP